MTLFARALLLFKAAAIAVLLLPQGAHAETRVALVIGNSDYQNVSRLKNPANDATAMATALKGLGFTVVEGRDLTRAAFEASLRKFAGLVEDAEAAVVFYAGHGVQVDGHNWLIPVDASLNTERDLGSGSIALTRVLDVLERAKRVRIVFLDACRDNPMAGLSGAAARAPRVGSSLARVEAGMGTIISYSTAPGEVASDGAGAHSPFAAALLESIALPGLDVLTLLTRVRAKVMAETSKQQTTWESSALVGDFFFKPGGRPPPPSVSIAGVRAARPALSSKIYATDDPACRRAQDAAVDIRAWSARSYLTSLKTDAEACFAGGKAKGWAHYLRGMARRARYDRAGAIEDFTAAIALHRDYADAYMARGRTYSELNDARAQADLDKAIAIAPNDPLAFLYRANLKKDSDRWAESIVDFDHALALDPALGAAYVGRASVRDTTDIVGALKDLETALRINPGDIDALVSRGYTLVTANRTVDAEADFARAIRLEPDNPAIYGIRGWAYYNSTLKCVPAFADTSKAIALGYNDPYTYVVHALCLDERGETAAALADLERAVQLAPNDEFVRMSRLATFFHHALHAQAIREGTEMLRLRMGNESSLLRGRGISYLETGQREKGLADLRRAQQLNPNDEVTNNLLKAEGG